MGDLFEEIEGMASKVNQPLSSGQIEGSREFLRLASQDLKASRLLFENDLSNLAVYHLQQSVEKTAKALYKILGILDDNAIRRTGHDTPELFLRMSELQWVEQFAQFAKEVTKTDFVTDTSQAQAVVDEQPKRLEMAKLNPERINVWLGLIPKLEEALSPFFVVAGKDLVMATLRLFILSALTFPHEQFSRYPDYPLKPSEYTPDLGIVAKMESLWVESETAISEVERLVESRNRFA